MKFGESLQLALISEFAEEYVDYQGIKQRIQFVASLPENEKEAYLQRAPDGSWPKDSPDEMLVANLEKVVNFFSTNISQLNAYINRLSNEDDPELARQSGSINELQERHEQIKDLDLRLQKLSSFAEWNKLAFEKLAARMDKHLGTDRQTTFYERKVSKLDFANSAKIYETLLSLKKLDSSQKRIDTLKKLEHISSKHPIKKDLLTYIQQDDVKEVAETCINAPETVLIDILAATIVAAAKACMREVVGRMGLRSECLASALRRAINNLEGPDHGVHCFLEVVKDICCVVYLEKDHLNSLLTRILAVERNSRGQTVMHSAAQSGYHMLCYEFCKIISSIPSAEPLNWMRPYWFDVMQDTPLSLAIRGNHVKVLHALLSCQDRGTPSTKPGPIPPLVLVCLVGDNAGMIKELLDAGFNSNEHDAKGSTCLHAAVRNHRSNCVETLIKHGVNQNIREAPFSWTPLMLASALGFSDIIKILVEAGSPVDAVDASGWTAMEHAVVRGNLEALDVLQTSFALSDGPVNLDSLSIKPSGAEVRSRKRAMELQPSSSIVILRLSGLTGRIRVTLEGEGTQYLSGKTSSSAVSSKSSTTDLLSTSLATNIQPSSESSNSSLLREKSASSTVVIDVPRSHFDSVGEVDFEDVVEPDETNDESIYMHYDAAQEVSLKSTVASPPYELIFITKDVDKTTVCIDALGHRSLKVIGRAYAQLSDFIPNLGKGMQSLKPLPSLTLLSNKGLKPIAKIHVDALVSTVPDEDILKLGSERVHGASSLEAVSNFDRSTLEDKDELSATSSKSPSESGKVSSVEVIGHRGLGKNQPNSLTLQLGENTVQSFIKAADLGASYVELDVQLTKDMIPVVYHDFAVNETGTDAQVHSLTLEQFLSVSHSPSDKPAEDVREYSLKRRPRAYSSSVSRSSDTQLNLLNLLNSQEDPVSAKQKVYKGNALGHSICAPFNTLRDILEKVPQSVGLNVEFKYPMLSEAEEENLLPVAYDYNAFVDTILSVIQKYGGHRRYIFSSFNPDICILLSLKCSVPVLFLTEGGTAFRTDARAASLKNAIKFAAQWNLLGIVSACEPLIQSPRLIKAVKQLKLACYTYGVLNNNTDNVRRQVRFGVDAVIVDNVLAVRKALNEGER
ncbi:glycerophosphoryl diester phosphodiesterase Gde1 [Schizosaccharomyces cryophilus OY26]|uniref:Glycerophosphoryl diester phosphodiesterase Gde1 n=1 Tax=Schizosaccharomyces cryophilus (strain OY26 / ATCC MYA-4695 / CBS 11777 / NBRC 106824 / NRRL Y48691) TaxID=653667 RepID=S9XE33_SCHCR|nr:glycerophosphoryl diester phosphodiesterase Gde1 [Schizosaccharomyces cryophilus OY26]EPY52036.1 glycerophosphoryl diester phosphodiesterase Gde1 [Schizosaccharomyces cryophilus OY26]